MPRIKRYHPVSHDFNRDPQIVEARKKFGDWLGYAWLEILSIADRNSGMVPGTIEQIADRLAPISLKNYLKPASKVAQIFLEYAQDCGWIGVELDYIRVLKYGEYHPSREAKEVPPKQPKQPNETKHLKDIPGEAIKMAQLLSDKIFENNPKRRPPTEANLNHWAEVADMLHRVDGISWDDMERVLLWSQQSEFWRNNILSMGTFREKWNQLSAQESQHEQRRQCEPKGFDGLRKWNRSQNSD